MSPYQVEAIHHVIRKCGHLTEYAILAILLWRAIRKPIRHDPRPWTWREAAIAALIVFLYASTDEFHQIFVPTRTALVSDVFIDTAGGIVGIIALRIICLCFDWRPKQKSPAHKVESPYLR